MLREEEKKNNKKNIQESYNSDISWSGLKLGHLLGFFL